MSSTAETLKQVGIFMGSLAVLLGSLSPFVLPFVENHIQDQVAIELKEYVDSLNDARESKDSQILDMIIAGKKETRICSGT